jgi:hypothetical protein
VEATWTNLLGEPSVGAVVSNYRDVTERRELQDALHKEAVTLGQEEGELVVVKGGLKAADRVAVGGLRQLEPGMAVKARPASSDK